MRRRLLLSLFLLVGTPGAGFAQQADLITGLVNSGDGRPLAGARVEAISLDTELTRSAVTGMDGRYVLLFPDGGGVYVVRVSYIGMTGETRPLVREGAEDLLLAHFTLYPQPIALDGLLVLVERTGPEEPGQESVVLTPELLNRLPLSDTEPETLALLAAGVVGMGVDSLSGRTQFSVGGMREELNQVTLDGVRLGDGDLGIPEEGVRRVEITTNTFDASRGGFAGGEVGVVSARGNRQPSGSLSLQMDNSALQLRAVPTAFASARTNVGGSWGGPMLGRSDLFYNVSFQVSRNETYRFALSAADPLAAERSGVSADSIARFLSIMEHVHGIPVGQQTGPYTQLNEDLRLQTRVDWNIFERDQTSHTLTARINANLNSQDSTRINTLDLMQHGGDTGRNTRQATVNLTSQFGRRFSNTLSLSYQGNSSDAIPYVEIPEGQVRVTSFFEDGTRASRNLVFGGNRNMPTEASGREFGFSNEVSMTRTIRDQIHRIKLGGSVDQSTTTSRSTSNLFGTFRFASLEDFEENRPDRYQRTLTERLATSGRVSGGLFFSDTWRVSEPLELTLGLRWDFSRLQDRPEYNPLVEQAFGRRNDVVPSASGWSPRMGFNYNLAGERGQRRSFNGGIGYFSGRAPTNIFSAAIRQTGLPNSEQSLLCIGEFVPVPDWDLYWNEPLSMPAECDDGTVATSPQSSRAPTVTLLQSDQLLPTSLRMDLGYRTPLPFGLSGNLRYQYSRGHGLWGYRDLNLDPSKAVRIGMDDRLFFGDPSSISARTGTVSMVSSRLDPEFAQVYDVTSDLRSRSHQVTASVNGTIQNRYRANVSYTLGHARDQGSGSLQQVTTAGNPNEAEWGVANNDRRHNLNLSLTLPLSDAFELTLNSRPQSGTPFSPLVNRDINGDGLRNDRAYVFHPDDPDFPEQAEQMRRLLENAPPRVRSCLESQFGRIAERNSCRGGWSQTLNMRVNFRPVLPKLERRATFSADMRNMLTGLDYVLHGREGMRGWGERERTDTNLLEVRGFDPATQTFRYQVNEGFGQDNRGPEAFRNAFSISLSVRVSLGGNPAQASRGFLPPQRGGGPGGGGPGGGGGAGGGPRGPGGASAGAGSFHLPTLAAMLEAQGENRDDEAIVSVLLRNPVARILTIPVARLSPEQEERLGAIVAELDLELEAHRGPLTEAVGRIAPLIVDAPESAVLPAGEEEVERQFEGEVRPVVEAARTEIAEAVEAARSHLSVEQWERLPQDIRAMATAPQPLPVAGTAEAFRGVVILDRILANPLPVLLDLRGAVGLDDAQVRALRVVSDRLQEQLIERREALGRQLENVPANELVARFREIFPQIEEGRDEIRGALRVAETLLTEEQWERVPEMVRDPFARRPGSTPQD